MTGTFCKLAPKKKMTAILQAVIPIERESVCVCGCMRERERESVNEATTTTTTTTATSRTTTTTDLLNQSVDKRQESDCTKKKTLNYGSNDGQQIERLK